MWTVATTLDGTATSDDAATSEGGLQPLFLTHCETFICMLQVIYGEYTIC